MIKQTPWIPPVGENKPEGLSEKQENHEDISVATAEGISKNLLWEKESSEHLEDTTETLVRLEIEIEELVKDKKLNNYYSGNTMNYLKSLYTDNDIFLRWDEIKSVGFLKKVIEFIKDPKKLGIDFGKEISEWAGRTGEGTGYYNRNNYKDVGLENKEKEVISVIEKLTGRSYVWDWEPELAFLPLILEMSAGYFSSTYSEGGFCYPGHFFLRVSRTGMLNINCQWGKLTWDEHNWHGNHYYPARDISQSS